MCVPTRINSFPFFLSFSLWFQWWQCVPFFYYATLEVTSFSYHFSARYCWLRCYWDCFFFFFFFIIILFLCHYQPRENCSVMQLGTNWEQQQRKKRNYDEKCVETSEYNNTDTIAQQEMIQIPIFRGTCTFSFFSSMMRFSKQIENRNKNGEKTWFELLLSDAIRLTSVHFMRNISGCSSFHLCLIYYLLCNAFCFSFEFLLLFLFFTHFVLGYFMLLYRFIFSVSAIKKKTCMRWRPFASMKNYRM